MKKFIDLIFHMLLLKKKSSKGKKKRQSLWLQKKFNRLQKANQLLSQSQLQKNVDLPPFIIYY